MMIIHYFSKGLGLVMTHSSVNLRLFDSRAHNHKQYQLQLAQCQENTKHSVNTESVTNSFGKH